MLSFLLMVFLSWLVKSAIWQILSPALCIVIMSVTSDSDINLYAICVLLCGEPPRYAELPAVKIGTFTYGAQYRRSYTDSSITGEPPWKTQTTTHAQKYPQVN